MPDITAEVKLRLSAKYSTAYQGMCNTLCLSLFTALVRGCHIYMQKPMSIH